MSKQYSLIKDISIERTLLIIAYHLNGKCCGTNAADHFVEA